MQFYHQNKCIGSLKEGIFRKRVKKSKHLMRLNNSWGVQLDALMKLQKEGCTEIRVLEEEEQKIYSTPLDVIMKTGTVENFGDGSQVFLSLSEWTVTDRHGK